MATKSFIGIRRLFYAPVIESIADPGDGLTADEVETILGTGTTKQVTNVHQDTWGYEESDPTIAEYLNELSGRPYYRDAETQSIPTISFTIGEYEYATKAAFQGGVATTNTWERPDRPGLIELCIIAQAKTGEVIVYPRASIVGKGNYVDKNIGVGVTAVPIETGVEGLAPEKWFRGITIP
jgi:hypothetical protein